MTYEQKLQALNALDTCQVLMRKPGDWYVLQLYVDIKKGGILEGVYGDGATPEEAILDHWNLLTNLQPGEYLVVRPNNENRKAVKWNGYMWEDVVA